MKGKNKLVAALLLTVSAFSLSSFSAAASGPANTEVYAIEQRAVAGQFNRYELVVAVAKCARIVTDEYVNMRAEAQKLIDNHETDKSLSALIDPEYKDKKAVKIAISKLEDGRFKMVHPEEK